MPRTKRTKEEQEAADNWHREKCRTTKFMACGSCVLLTGVALLAGAMGVYETYELDEWGGAQYNSNCYIRANSNDCPCIQLEDADKDCTQNTYIVSIDGDTTCQQDECEAWDNGCQAWSFEEECTVNAQFETGDRVACYSYEDGLLGTGNTCFGAGRIDPDGEWQGNHTTFVVLLVFAVVLLVAAIVLFVVGGMRCVCKKMDDDVLGSTNGTGCYWCMDYERCCYGEGTGHAIIHNPQGVNLPVRDKKGRTADRTDAGDGDDDDDEEQELR